MVRSKKKAILKKKRGRPATGRDPVTALRLPAKVLTEVDGWARRNNMTRSKAIRLFIEQALAVSFQ